MEQKYLELAVDAALKAGAAILSVYNGPVADFQIEQKADHSPLTRADRKAHEVIAGLLGTTPFPVLSEEGKDMDYSVRRTFETLWIVDPLDGTKEFIKRNGEFTVNIALVHRSVPVLGVVYVPVKRLLYFGTESGGAFRCEEVEAGSASGYSALAARAERLPLAQPKDGFVVVASRSHLTAETEAYIDGLRRQHPDIAFVSKGSSIKLCLVAEGAADVYPRFAPTMEWDTAAGHAVVRAAGHEVWQTDMSSPLQYNKENLLNPYFVCR